MSMLKGLKKKNKNDRFTLFFIVFIAIFVVIVLRLFYLQVIEGFYYRSLADGNRIRVLPTFATRGVLYDRTGKILVSSRQGFVVSLVKTGKKISEEELANLSELLNMPIEDLNDKINKFKDAFEPVVLAYDVGQDIVTRIEERKNDLPTVIVDIKPIRYYPYNEMGAQLFGYIGEASEDDIKNKSELGLNLGDSVGFAGIESYYDKVLRGKNGGKQIEVDVTGKSIREIGRKKVTTGKNIWLTIDWNLQSATEKAVDEHLTNLANQNVYSSGVAVLAMDPNTGAILAMVNRPNFNPNDFAKGISTKKWNDIINNPNVPLENKTISGQYPPGSIFKIITGATALELKKVTAEEEIFDSGRHELVDMRNADGNAHGWLNFREAMAKSDNVYFYELSYRTGIDEIEKFSNYFGLGKKTGIDLYGEQSGLIASEKYKKEVFNQEWYLGDTFNAAIGQGLQLTTPLQIAQIFNQVANGGIFYKPYLVSRIDDLNGDPEKIFLPEKVSVLKVSKSTMDIIRESLLAVTLEGTAESLFRGFPIEVASKTSTSENYKGRDHGLFAAYAPYNDPKITIVIIVEQGGYGGSAAGPIAKKMLEAFFNL